MAQHGWQTQRHLAPARGRTSITGKPYPQEPDVTGRSPAL